MYVGTGVGTIFCVLYFEQDLDSEEASISYTKNGEDLGVAFTFSKVDVPVLYPHILVKNTECKINCGAQVCWIILVYCFLQLH